MSLALRAGACRRNVDGVRLLACGIGGVSVTGVILLSELSLLKVAARLLDVVAPAHFAKPLVVSIHRRPVSHSLRYQAAREIPIVFPTPVPSSQLLDHKSSSALSLFSRPFLLSSAPTRRDSINNGNKPRSCLPLTARDPMPLTGQHKSFYTLRSRPAPSSLSLVPQTALCSSSTSVWRLCIPLRSSSVV